MCSSEFANEAALRFFEHAIRNRKAITAEQACEIALEASEAYCSLGRSHEAISMLRRELARTEKRGANENMVRLHAKLSQSYNCSGDTVRSEESALRGLTVSRHCIPGPQTDELKAALLVRLVVCALLK